MRRRLNEAKEPKVKWKCEFHARFFVREAATATVASAGPGLMSFCFLSEFFVSASCICMCDCNIIWVFVYICICSLVLVWLPSLPGYACYFILFVLFYFHTSLGFINVLLLLLIFAFSIFFFLLSLRRTKYPFTCVTESARIGRHVWEALDI